MGSPTKRKFKQGVQQQILTNYYLSKYDRFMSRYTDGQNRTQLPQRQPPINPPNNPKRKNFKQVMLQRKGTHLNNKQRSHQKSPKSNSNKKNFKHQVQLKNSKQKVSKQNRKNFYRLQDTIISQLYKPSPSQIEKGNYQQIQIVHNVSYGDKVEPFRIASTQQQENIQIVEQQDHLYLDRLKQAKYQVEVQKLQLSKLSNAIKSSFQKRSPNKSRKQSKSPQAKFPPKYNQNISSQQISQPHQESIFFENVRPTFESIQSRRQSFVQRHHLQEFEVRQKNRAPSQSLMQSDRLSNGNNSHKSLERAHQNFMSRRSQLQKSINDDFPVPEKVNRISISRRSSMNKEINEFKTRSTHNNHDDSFHHNVPEIQQEPKINYLKQKQQNSDQARSSRSNRSMASSRARQVSQFKSIQNKQSLHQLSMLSRFSMTSTQGGQIVDYLQRQLNQNEFGPYQNALTSLLTLIGQYPNAWPIFVVGQRILDDRRQYDAKRNLQQNQINRLQAGIQQIKKGKPNKRLTEVQKNNIQILKLTRELAKRLEQKNEIEQ